MRAKTMHVKLWWIDADRFMSHIKSLGGKINILKKWRKENEKRLMNKLARNLFNNLQGMNIDGANDSEHNQY